jgi:hypothetical protein
MKNALVVVGLCAALSTAVACGPSREEQARQEVQKAAAEAGAAIEQARGAAEDAAGTDAMAKGLEEMAAGLQKMGEQQVEPVGFRELQAFFPDLEGWTREKPTGEKVSMGIKMSRAGVRYVKGNATMEMEITDSSLNQAMIAPFAMMLAAGYEKESADGFERSAKVGGQAGWEKWDDATKDGELNAVVAKRFIVKIAGSNLDDLSPLHTLASRADLGRLSTLSASPQ